MKIFILSSVYPSKSSPKGTTPVVHYFAKEWVCSGNKVRVVHITACFPKLYYVIVRPFKKLIDSGLGHLIPLMVPIEYEEEREGVIISHINLKKIKPHGRFSKKQVRKAFDLICKIIKNEGVPDCFVGHWDNPQLELLSLLKREYHKRVCLVYHSNDFSYLYNLYNNDTVSLVNNIDLVGFRNNTAREKYEELFGNPKHSFICSSGVSKPFIMAGNGFDHKFDSVRHYSFVGNLIARKHPATIAEALLVAYGDEPFEVTYIGEGNEMDHIQHLFDKHHCAGRLTFTGRIPRDEVIGYLKITDVFVMISQDEIFGLVYLEAMALGCICIASRHEGIDGIIIDGINGFLCEAGNVEELTSIINRIRSMSQEELMWMSKRAKMTAITYTDRAVADLYLCELKTISV